MPTKITFVLAFALALAAAISAVADEQQTKINENQQAINCKKSSTQCDKVPKAFLDGRTMPTNPQPSPHPEGDRTNK